MLWRGHVRKKWPAQELFQWSDVGESQWQQRAKEWMRRYTNGQEAHKKRINTVSHQGTANQNHSEIPLYTHKDSYSKKDRQSQLLVRIWRNWNPHALLMRLLSSAAALESSLLISFKVKHAVTIWPAIPVLGMCLGELKTYVHFYTNVHSSVIHNSKKLETTQMSIKWWMNKQNVIYT